MQPGKRFAISFFSSLSCLLMLVLASCGSSNGATPATTATSKAPDSKQIYVTAQGGHTDIKTFDPALSTDAGSNYAIQAVFTGLVQFDDKLQITDQLAASHSVSSDGMTWTFKLKPNLKFSDGTPLTSQDVIYSIDRSLKPSLKSTVSPTYLALVKDSDKRFSGKIPSLINDSLLAPDPQTVVIKTNQKAAYFLDALAYSTSYVVEKSLIDKYGDTQWVEHLNEGGGAGPWEVTKWQHGKDIEFAPNPNYYGPHPQLHKLILAFFATVDTAFKTYKTGGISSTGVPTPDISEAKAMPNNQFHLVPQLWINWYAMNYLVKPFDNTKIRQAFALALNKDLIAQKVHRGVYIATNHIVPEGMPGYNPNLTGPAGVKGTAGDPALAKKLFQEGLQEEGMTLQTLPTIRLTYASSFQAEMDNEIAVVQQMWHDVLGVTVKPESVDLNKLYGDISNATNNPQGLMLWMLGWVADYPDPQDWLTLQFGKGSANNNVNFGQNQAKDAAQQQALQQEMIQADANTNPTDRMQQYMKIEQELVNDAVVIPEYQVAAPKVRKPCVAGFEDNDLGLVAPDSWSKVYISTDPTCANTSIYQ
ncbi:peptide ABC transporter substrate-binding protein [Ktedonosporobacter rubrisoli]|uniref:Peptide ABC transporter substrate-binding protein n=1 Tax=Ktedonosporobacter rubrisoli TaxID=2509675 RepID=A0A4P6JPV7_KTERU|nr:peptide ABC transporter substrate-binding protein [Ktedonosporobacter rubrisoli]QBD77428.1 peptide ABC transporter substrate-binding protein [Ktedonosporobacter rubrisoli]